MFATTFDRLADEPRSSRIDYMALLAVFGPAGARECRNAGPRDRARSASPSLPPSFQTWSCSASSNTSTSGSRATTRSWRRSGLRSCNGTPSSASSSRWASASTLSRPQLHDRRLSRRSRSDGELRRFLLLRFHVPPSRRRADPEVLLSRRATETSHPDDARSSPRGRGLFHARAGEEDPAREPLRQNCRHGFRCRIGRHARRLVRRRSLTPSKSISTSAATRTWRSASG